MDISPEQAFSPAGLAKATLREMGITPPLSRLGEVTNEDLGIAMVGYYGGRAEVRIRAMPHPVRYADVSSMYTTVFSLLDLHRHLVAQKFEVRDITADAREYVERIDRAALHDPAEWPFLAGVYCRVRPADDLLPARMMHSAESGGSTAWTIGVNFVTSAVDLWYTLADVVAAKVGSGRAPQILEARRIAPMGRLSTLRAVELRSQVAVDPLEDDLFRRAIELRHRIRRTDGEVPERGSFSRRSRAAAPTGPSRSITVLSPSPAEQGSPQMAYGRSRRASGRQRSQVSFAFLRSPRR